MQALFWKLVRSSWLIIALDSNSLSSKVTNTNKQTFSKRSSSPWLKFFNSAAFRMRTVPCIKGTVTNYAAVIYLQVHVQRQVA